MAAQLGWLDATHASTVRSDATLRLQHWLSAVVYLAQSIHRGISQLTFVVLL